MHRSHERNSSPETNAQNIFYEASKQWVLSLKERHDPHDLMGILDNDIERYPFQDINQVLLPSYQPPESVGASEKAAIQASILESLRVDGDSVMGDGYFDKFVDDLMATTNFQGAPESALKNVSSRLSTPRQNIATVGFHANIMALPVYSAAITCALSRTEFNSGQFDLFEFSRQNILPVNPALVVASFKGQPAVERLTAFSTILKTPPPTRSVSQYGFDRKVLRRMSKDTKVAAQQYLDDLYAKGKSAYLTIDPTASTFEPVNQDGRPALRRNPVNRSAQLMILKDFNFVWPITMMLNGDSSAWYISEPQSLWGDIEKGGRFFKAVIDNLDRQTEKLAGVKMLVDYPERQIGKLAIEQ